METTTLKIVIKSQDTERIWSAWSDEDHIWFFTAEMSPELSREHGCPALEVASYEVDGLLRAWQRWTCLKDGTWQQCAL